MNTARVLRRTLPPVFGVVLLALLVVGGNYLSTTYYQRWDLTRDQSLSLSSATTRLLEGLDDRVVLRFFPLPAHISRGPHTRRNRRALLDLLRQYAARSERVVLQLLPPDRFPERVRRVADRYGIDETALMQREPLLVTASRSSEYRLIPFDAMRPIQTTSNGNNQPDRPSVNSARAERWVTASIHALARSRQITIDFVRPERSGAESVASEQPPEPFHTVIELLENREGFRVRRPEPSLSTSLGSGDLLVLPPDGGPYDSDDLGRIRTYLKEGGDLIVLAAPGSHEGLASLLRKQGIKLTDFSLPPDSTDDPARTGLEALDWYRSHFITDPLLPERPPLYMGRTRVVDTAASTSGRRGHVFLGVRRTQRDLQARDGDEILQHLITDEQGTALPVAAASDASEVDGKGASAHQDAARVVVFGGANWVTDRVLKQTQKTAPDAANVPLFLNAVRWGTGLTDELRHIPDRRAGTHIVVTEQKAAAIFTLVVVLIPGCAVLLGITIWWLRRMRM